MRITAINSNNYQARPNFKSNVIGKIPAPAGEIPDSVLQSISSCFGNMALKNGLIANRSVVAFSMDKAENDLFITLADSTTPEGLAYCYATTFKDKQSALPDVIKSAIPMPFEYDITAMLKLKEESSILAKTMEERPEVRFNQSRSIYTR